MRYIDPLDTIDYGQCSMELSGDLEWNGQTALFFSDLNQPYGPLQYDPYLNNAYATYRLSHRNAKTSGFIKKTVAHSPDKRLGMVSSHSTAPSFIYLYDGTTEPASDLWDCLASLIIVITRDAPSGNVTLEELAKLDECRDVFERLLRFYGDYAKLTDALLSAEPSLRRLVRMPDDYGVTPPKPGGDHSRWGRDGDTSENENWSGEPTLVKPFVGQGPGLRHLEWYDINHDYIQRHPELDPRKLDFSRAVEKPSAGGYAGKTWQLEGVFIKGFKVESEMLDVIFDPKAAAEVEYKQILNVNECSHTVHALGWGCCDDNGTRRVVLAETLAQGEPLKKSGRAEGAPSGSYYRRVLGGRSINDADSKNLLKACTAISVAIAEFAAAGEVHRDLAPSNVHLSSVEGGFRAELVDLGIAIKTGGGITPPDYARNGQLPFASPESFKGSTYYGLRDRPSADVWSLGALCSFIVTGDVPYGRTAHIDADKRRFGETGLPSETVKALGSVGNDVQAIVLDCLKYDPRERITAIQAALRFQACLERLEGGAVSGRVPLLVNLVRAADLGADALASTTKAEEGAELQQLRDRVQQLEAERTKLQEQAARDTQHVTELEHSNASLKAENNNLRAQSESYVAARSAIMKAFGLQGGDTTPPMSSSDHADEDKSAPK